MTSDIVIITMPTFFCIFLCVVVLYVSLIVSLFKKKNCKRTFKIIIDAYVAVKNIIQRDLVILLPISPNGNIFQNYRIISQPGN